MKKSYFLFFALILTSITFSQSIKVGVLGGTTMFQSPDEFTKSITEGGFGFNNSIHYGIKGKFEIPLLPLSMNASILYVPLSSEESSIKLTSNLLALGIGAEWSFIPGPISPYASIDLLFNSFGELKLESPFGNLKEKGFTRNGFAFGGGITFTLLPMIDLDLSAKYAYYNLLGTKGGEKAVTSINITGGIYISFLW